MVRVPHTWLLIACPHNEVANTVGDFHIYFKKALECRRVRCKQGECIRRGDHRDVWPDGAFLVQRVEALAGAEALRKPAGPRHGAKDAISIKCHRVIPIQGCVPMASYHLRSRSSGNPSPEAHAIQQHSISEHRVCRASFKQKVGSCGASSRRDVADAQRAGHGCESLSDSRAGSPAGREARQRSESSSATCCSRRAMATGWPVVARSSNVKLWSGAAYAAKRVSTRRLTPSSWQRRKTNAAASESALMFAEASGVSASHVASSEARSTPPMTASRAVFSEKSAG